MRTRVEVIWKMEAAFVGAKVKTCGNVHSRHTRGKKRSEAADSELSPHVEEP